MENIVEIESNGYIAKINLSRGANCISLRHKEYNAVILHEPDYSNTVDNPYIYGMPILFPSNRISDGKFEFEGREYKFPVNEPSTGCHVHGVMHEAKFELVELSDSKVICAYKADRENPYLEFPHEFEILITYEINNGLEQTTEVINKSAANMPCVIGFHTTFNIFFTNTNKKENVLLMADIKEEYERSNKNYLPTGKIIEFDDNSQKLSEGRFIPFGNAISRHYKAQDQGKMCICNMESGLTVVYENSKNLGYRLILTDGKEYVCMEPQNSLVNSPNSPFGRNESGFEYIKPGESKKYISKIYLCEASENE